MVRGPTPSGRGPAHLTVLPGGANRVDDDDERTTIEPGPPTSEEAPTPIARAADEHWEDGTTVAESAKKLLEEATIDDQARTLPPLQLVPPVHPRAQARLVVVTGPDQGRHYELGGGNKPMFVGRAMENDVVLTDLSVSRRHLELIWEPDRWVLRDCGSGNGTLINDRLEDGQCQLRHGDRIEIGNTIFRFDHAASADGDGSVDVPIAGWGQDADDDEELATVNGRPGKSGETHLPEAAGRAPRFAPTVPPVPRSRTTTSAPSVPPPRPRPAPTPAPPPGPHILTSGPGRPPGLAPSASSPGVPQATAAGASMSMPGFGVDAQRPMGGFPPSAMPVMVPSLRPWPVAMLQRYDRRKLYLALGGGALTLAIIIGAIAGGGAGPAHPAPTDDPAPAPAKVSAQGVADVPVPPPVVTPAGSGPGSAAIDPAPPVVPDGLAPSTPTPGSLPGAGPGSTVAPPPGAAPGAGGVTVTAGTGPGSTVAPQTPGVDSGTTVAAMTAGTPPGSPPVPPGTGPGSALPPPPPPATTSRIKPDKPPRTDRPPTDRVVDRPRVEPDPPPAAANSKAIAAAERKAADLYRARKFSEAATTLRAVTGDATDAESRRLLALAKNYESLGNNLTSGQAADAVVAYTALTRAMSTDRKVGAAHRALISERLAQVAPQAAKTSLARGNYEQAKKAADAAVNFGAGSNGDIAKVRSSLESKAGSIYTAAIKLMAKKPDEAAAQFRLITKMVESTSPWYAKAQKQLDKVPRRDDDE